MTNPQVWGQSEEGNWVDLSYVTDMTLSEDTLVASVDPAAEVEYYTPPSYVDFLRGGYAGYPQRYVLSARGLSERVPSELEFEFDYLDSGHYTWDPSDDDCSPDSMTYTAGDEPETRAHP